MESIASRPWRSCRKSPINLRNLDFCYGRDAVISLRPLTVTPSVHTIGNVEEKGQAEDTAGTMSNNINQQGRKKRKRSKGTLLLRESISNLKEETLAMIKNTNEKADETECRTFKLEWMMHKYETEIEALKKLVVMQTSRLENLESGVEHLSNSVFKIRIEAKHRDAEVKGQLEQAKEKVYKLYTYICTQNKLINIYMFR
jgi:hypothetical protein